MKKFDINIINQQIDKLNFDLLTVDEIDLINQLNKSIFIVSYQLAIMQYDEKITIQLNQLVDKINAALNNVNKYNINIILYAIYNSLKLLSIFSYHKAELIWNKFFINNLAKQNEPEMLFNEKIF